MAGEEGILFDPWCVIVTDGYKSSISWFLKVAKTEEFSVVEVEFSSRAEEPIQNPESE